MSVPDDINARPLGKGSRNEGRKLLATWLNGVSIACFLAASLQPLLGVVQQPREFRLVELLLSLILFVASAGLHAGAQVIIRRLED